MKNRLAQETSPYLQQHADNPVDWYPWGPEALAESKRSGKPILLSVGYSACHWCHVMAHESFEDAGVASVMNELFVNVKVDREERPDIDQIYQVAQQMLTQRTGGWPLTMFLTPEQLPFFGGTYFPKTARYGLPGFGDLLVRVREFYDANRTDIEEQNARLLDALSRTGPGTAGPTTEFTRAPLDESYRFLKSTFDPTDGGFGQAPKFPHPDSIELLLRRFAANGDRDALAMATFTLTKMAEGGLFDQLGGGFARYSVDDEWAIPHFEKMLYDNGWLLRLYADAWVATRDPVFERACRETVAWVLREMQSPEGGYYSSLDADSEGHEGKFYVWTPDEVRALLTEDEYAVVAPHYGLDRPPNFENHDWHFVTAQPLAKGAEALLAAARAKLFAAREKRIRPGRDDKVLTSWNALMIAGMARAARAFGLPEWLTSARKSLDFIRTTMWKDGALLATYKDGKAHLDAYLDDYAFLLAALLEVLQADFDSRDLAWATELGDVLLADFEDKSNGGFFFTAHGHEKLIHRPKPGHDNATPSGNGVAAQALIRLTFLTGDLRYQQAAERTLALYWPQMIRHPGGFGSLLGALEESLVPTRTVIVNGPAPDFGPWRALLDGAYLPTSVSLFLPDGAANLPAPLAKPVKGVNAWVCEGVTCLPPLDSPARLRETLGLPTIAPSA
ncbi:thioredoxin domain-containing protein [Usitatibacter palustris]|uniref:thioredoxin domain-containing protein n=1 Tax=Usitatibacter palustris TaxID=2732487 RepID=UPI0014879F29|nr:thioredoxin domain-containing protein [Usitatibacter palustris]